MYGLGGLLMLGLYQNADLTHDVASRGGLTFLFIWAFMMFTSTSTHILVAGIDSADSAGSVGNICYMLCISFCGYVPYFSLPFSASPYATYVSIPLLLR